MTIKWYLQKAIFRWCQGIPWLAKSLGFCDRVKPIWCRIGPEWASNLGLVHTGLKWCIFSPWFNFTKWDEQNALFFFFFEGLRWRQLCCVDLTLFWQRRKPFSSLMGCAMYSSGGSNEPPELAIYIYIYIYKIYFLFNPPK